MGFIFGMLLGALLAIVALGVIGKIRQRKPTRRADKPGEWFPVSHGEFGEGWPFTAPSGQVTVTKRGAVLFLPPAAPHAYGLNGTADQLGYESVLPIWRDHPDRPNQKVSLHRIIQHAHAQATAAE